MLSSMALLQLLFLTAILATSRASSEESLIRLPDQTHRLRPYSDEAGHHVRGFSCLSWRLGVETNNIIEWKKAPKECEGYIRDYMLGTQYLEDSKMVADQAFLYAKGLSLAGDGKDLWVFDIDETALSNLPYFVDHGFGTEDYDAAASFEWIITGKAPALPESLGLYKKLLSLGIKVVFIAVRSEETRDVTETNLRNVGFHGWERLILPDNSTTYTGNVAVVYKSSERAKLEKMGYRIVGNIGDQWSDLTGTNIGNRTFKLPNPMYYIGRGST